MRGNGGKTFERFFKFFIPIALVAAMLSGLLLYQKEMIDSAQQRIYRTLGESAEDQVNFINSALQNQYTLLSSCAELMLSQELSLEELEAQMAKVADASDYSYLFYIDPTGRAYFSSGDFAAVADRHYFQEALAGRNSVERIKTGRVDSSDHFNLAVPIYSEGEITGVLAGTYGEKEFRSLLISEAFSGSSSSFLCDATGKIIVGAEKSTPFITSKNIFHILQNATFSYGSGEACREALTGQESGVISFTLGGVKSYAVYQPLGVNHWVIFNVVPAAAVQSEVNDTIQSGLFIILYMMILALCFVGVVAFLIRRQNHQLEREKEQLRLSDERFHIALENSGVTVWDYDFATQTILQGEHSMQRHGFEKIVPNVPESLIQSGFIHPESAGAFREMYRKLLAGEEKVEGVFRVQTADRSDYWYEHIRYTSQCDANGVPYRAIGMSEDVTEKYETEQAYKRELSYRQTEDSNIYSRALLNITRRELVEYQSNNAAQQECLQKASLSEFFRQTAEGVISDDGVRAYFLSLTPELLQQNYAEGKTTITFDYLRRFPDGSEIWVSYQSHLLLDPNTGDLMDFWYLRNIDEAKRRIDELSNAAEHDSMTGLYNHQATLQYISRFLSMEGQIGCHALFMLDIDNFKSVNDTLGHQRGDEVITEVAGILKKLFRATDILGRIGGDEFLVLMKGAGSLDVIHHKARELIAAMQFACTSSEGSVTLSGSLGVGIYRHGDTSDTLYSKADSAMYSAKNAGKNRYAVCDNSGTSLALPPVDSGHDDIQMIHYKTLLENIDGGILLAEVGDSIHVTYASPSFKSILRKEYSDCSEMAKVITQQILDEDREGIRAMMREAVASGKAADHIFRVHTDEGIGWRHLRVVRIPGNEGLPQLIGVVSDVTALKESTIQLEAIVAHSPIGIAILTVGDEIRPQFMNPALMDMIGYTREEYESLYSQNGLSMVCKEDQPRVQQEINDALRENRTAEITFCSCPKKDGTVDYLFAHGVRLEGHGPLPCLLVMLSDVTREKHSEMEMNLLKETYRIAMEQTGASLWKMDISTRTLYSTRLDLGSDGISEVSIANMPQGLLDSGVIDPDSQEEVRRMFQNLLEGNDGEEYLIAVLNENGKMWHRCQFRLLHNGNAAPFAIGITAPAPNVEAEMLRFRQEQRFFDSARTTLLQYFHVNLSKDKIVRARIYDDSPPAHQEPHTYTGLYRFISSNAVEETDLQMVLLKTSEKYLTRYFQSGSDWLFFEFRRKTADGRIRWTSSSIKLMRHPVSGDLFAFFYLRDIDEKHRWELAIPCKPERDSSTYLFTRETAEAMIHYILTSNHESQKQCALSVFELVNLAHVKAERGIAASNNALFTVGRLFRVLVDGHSLASRLDETHLLVFRTDVNNAEEYQKKVSRLIRQVFESQESSLIEEPVDLIAGLDIEALCCADYEVMLQKALAACENSMQQISRNISIFSSEEETKAPACSAASPAAPAPSVPDVDADAALRPLTRQDYYRMLRDFSPDTVSTMGVLFADVNGMMKMNQTCGMQYGDAMLDFIGRTLVEAFGRDCVFRTAGEEFLVICPDWTEEAFFDCCEKAAKAIDHTYTNALSIGQVWNDHVKDLPSMENNAIEQMRAAKTEYYRQNGSTDHLSHSRVEEWLHQSLDENRFLVYLQPKVQAKTRQIAGCEALVRYCDPERGIIPPTQFIPVLERDNLIPELDLFVLKTAVELLLRWQKAGQRLIPIAVNFSRTTLLYPTTFDTVQKLMAPHPELRSYLEIEITETMGTSERSTIVNVCGQYRSAGFRLGLDDFGSEYSSLHFLALQQFDTIKLDKSVIDDIESSKVSRLIVQNTKRVADQEGSVLVAEGVENEEQYKILRRIGCDLLQGYLFNKPLTIEAFEKQYHAE